MAGRVNTKFVLVLGTIIALAVVMLFGVWYLILSRTPEEFARKGDLYLRDGDLELAVENYGKAVQRRPGSIVYLDKYFDALIQWPIEGQVAANQNLQLLMNARRMKAEAEPDNENYLQEHYQFLVDLAESLNAEGLYRRLYNNATVKLDAVAGNRIARRYRGIAQVHLMIDRADAFDIPREDQLRAGEDLLAVLDQSPDDTQILHHRARWALFNARFIRHGSGDPKQIQRDRLAALALSRRMLEIDPQDVDLQMDHLRILLRAAEDIRQDVEPDEPQIDSLNQQALTLLEAIESAFLADLSSVDQVLELATFLSRLDTEEVELTDTTRRTTRGILRATALLTQAVDQHPRKVAYLVRLGRLQMATGKADQALTTFEQAVSQSQTMPAIEFLRTRNDQAEALLQTGLLLIAQRGMSEDVDQLDKRVEALIRKIEIDYRRSPALNMLEGKLRHVQGRFAQSQQLFDKAARDLGELEPQTMLWAAQASLRRGEWGDAARRFDILLTQDPSRTQLRVQLANVYLKGKQFEKVQRQIELLKETRPDDPSVRLLEANLFLQQGRTDEAIVIYESLDRSKNPALDLMLARLYLLKSRSDEARTLIEARFDEKPQDLTLLQLLLNLAEDPDQKQAYLAQAREGGADAQRLALVERQMGENPATADELADLLLDLQKDPFANAMARTQRALQSGDLQRAESALSEAAALRPDDLAVVRTRFAIAIEREQWDKASQIAERAKALNLDLAEGAFFRAQLAGAQKQWDVAVVEYEEALAKRPVYAEGWREFGNAQAQLKRLRPALEAYQRAIELQPDNVAALSSLAYVEAQLGRFDESLNHARQAWRYRPNNSALFESYLRSEQAYGDANVALDLRQQLAKIKPDNSANQRAICLLLAQLDRHDEAIERLEQLIEREGPTTANVIAHASLLKDIGQVAKGEQVIVDYISQRGDEVTGQDHLMLGQYRLGIGNVDGAIEAYVTARSFDDSEKQEYARLLADLLFGLNRHEAAIRVYREVYEHVPDDRRIILRLSEALIRTQQFDDAEGLLDGLEVEKENQATLYLLRSTLALPRTQDVSPQELRAHQAEALRWVNLAVTADANNAVAYLRRAMLLQGERAQRSNVIADLNRCLELNERFTEARRLLARVYLGQDNRPEAIRELQQLIKQSPQDTQARMLLINLHLGEKDLLSADVLVDEVIELQPDQAVWYGLKVNLAMRAGREDEALEAMARAVALEPSPQIISRYALMLISNKRVEEALSVLREHAEQVNRLPVLGAIRARALWGAGRKQEAISLFATVMREAADVGTAMSIAGQLIAAMGPGEAATVLGTFDHVREPLWIELAIAQTQANRGLFDETVARLEAIAKDLGTDTPTQLIYHRMLGLSAYQTKRYDLARTAYERVLELAPDDTGTLNNLAYLLVEEMDEVEAGLDFAERAAKANPDSAQVLDTLGWAQYKAGQLDKARQTLQTSIDRQLLAPNCLHLAQVYMELGQPNRAISLLDQVVELEETNDESLYKQQAEQLLAKLNPAAQ